MKTLVIGLDSAVPELLLRDERLTNFRRLMEGGCYGELETIIPPITVPAWMCMATSQDPGSLGVYGFRNRTDHSYNNLGIVNSKAIQEIAIWDQVAREGKRSTIIGVPPSYPPRKVNGVCIGCFMTPDTNKDHYTQPPQIKEEIAKLVGEYPVDVKGFRTENKGWLKDEIYDVESQALRSGAAHVAVHRLGLLPVRRDRPRPIAARILEVPRSPTRAA
ncbi:MAG: alkaline phosphatase family protein [Pyrinomonadaceae bacterium]